MSHAALLYPLVPPSGILATTVVSFTKKPALFLAATPNWLEIFEINALGFHTERRRVQTQFSPSCMCSFRPKGSESDWIVLINGCELIFLEFCLDDELQVRYKFAVSAFSDLSNTTAQTIAVDPSGNRILAHMGANMFIEAIFTSNKQAPKTKTFSFSGEELKHILWLDESKVLILAEVYAGLEIANVFEVRAKRFVKAHGPDSTVADAVAVIPSSPDSCFIVTKRDVRWMSTTLGGNTKIIHSFHEDILSATYIDNWIYVALASGKIGRVERDNAQKKTLLDLPTVISTIYAVDGRFVFGHNEIGSRLLIDTDGNILFQESLLGNVTGLDFYIDRHGQSFEVVESSTAAAAASNVTLSCPVKVLSTISSSAIHLFSADSRIVSTNILGSRSWDVQLDTDEILKATSQQLFAPDAQVLAVSGKIVVTTEGIFSDGAAVWQGDLECASIHKNTVLGGFANNLYTVDVLSKDVEVVETEENVYSVLQTENHRVYSTMGALHIDGIVKKMTSRCHQMIEFEDSLVSCHPEGWVSFLSFDGKVIDRCFVGKFVTAVPNEKGKCLLVGSGKGAMVSLTPWGLVSKRLHGIPEGSRVAWVAADTYAIGGQNITIFEARDEEVVSKVETHLLPNQVAYGLCRTGQDTWATLVTKKSEETTELLEEKMKFELAEVKDSRIQKRQPIESENAFGQSLIYLESPQHKFRGIIAAGNLVSGHEGQPVEKSLLVLFDSDKQQIVDKAEVEGTITVLKHTNTRHFIAAVDSVVQSWHIKFSSQLPPKLEFKDNVATVGRFLSCLDFYNGFLLVADQVMSVSIAPAKGAVEQRNIMTCPSIKWPINGILMGEQSMSTFVSTIDKESSILVADETSPGGLAPATSFAIGQNVTCSIRSSYTTYLKLAGNQSEMLESIAPEVFFGTGAGAIYGLKLLDAETAALFEKIVQVMKPQNPLLTVNDESNVLDASQILWLIEKADDALLNQAGWTKAQHDELKYALRKLFS